MLVKSEDLQSRHLNGEYKYALKLGIVGGNERSWEAKPPLTPRPLYIPNRRIGNGVKISSLVALLLLLLRFLHLDSDLRHVMIIITIIINSTGIGIASGIVIPFVFSTHTFMHNTIMLPSDFPFSCSKILCGQERKSKR